MAGGEGGKGDPCGGGNDALMYGQDNSRRRGLCMWVNVGRGGGSMSTAQKDVMQHAGRP